MKPKQHLHEKRHVTLAELGALLGVRALLASGHIKMHRVTPIEKRAGFVMPKANEHGFRMRSWLDSCHCGSVGCIGGYMEMLMGAQATELYDNNLHALFYPDTIRKHQWNDITPKHAVQAIDNWLRTGKPRWAKVLGAK